MIDLIDFSSINGSECQRLFHGRGHAFTGFEHINIDWLPPVIVIGLYTELPRTELESLAQQLKDRIAHCQSVQVQYRYQLKAPFEVLMGKSIEQTIIEEDGLKFHIQLGQARNTGLFLDMCNGRRWVRQHSQDKHVLNLFAYTCGFSVAAIAGGAKRVVNIDNNKGVLSRGRENHRLNGQDTRKVDFEGVNIFTSWSRVKKYAPYDMLICDPPTFQKGSVDIERDYKKIISRIPQFMKPGAELMLCLNAPDLSADFIQQNIDAHCPDCQYIEQINTPPVFKEAVSGKGLKTLIYRYQPRSD